MKMIFKVGYLASSQICTHRDTHLQTHHTQVVSPSRQCSRAKSYTGITLFWLPGSLRCWIAHDLSISTQQGIGLCNDYINEHSNRLLILKGIEATQDKSRLYHKGRSHQVPSNEKGLVKKFLFSFFFGWQINDFCVYPLPPGDYKKLRGEGPRSSLFTAFAISGTTTTLETLGHLYPARRAQLDSISS